MNKNEQKKIEIYYKGKKKIIYIQENTTYDDFIQICKKECKIETNFYLQNNDKKKIDKSNFLNYTPLMVNINENETSIQNSEIHQNKKENIIQTPGEEKSENNQRQEKKENINGDNENLNENKFETPNGDELKKINKNTTTVNNAIVGSGESERNNEYGKKDEKEDNNKFKVSNTKNKVLEKDNIKINELTIIN